jgi:hypothetical protein
VSDYSYSEYKFSLITTVEGEDYKEDLYVRYNVPDTDAKLINNKYYQLNKEYYYSYRLEMTVKKENFETDIVDLPTYMESYLYISCLEYNELTEMLRIAGKAFVWDCDFGVDSNPHYIVYLTNMETGDVYYKESQGLSSLEGFYYKNMTSDANEVFGTNYDYSNIFYDVYFDISQLPEGTYYSFVKIISNDILDYVDLKTRASIDQLDYSSDDITITSQRNYDNKNCIEIIIDKK